ncbi:FYN-binding protein 1 isoform X2 [Apus apus]|uniref:FYN-binding protein 1 isoform X2 n=1 Tax=Apus apus TaxID=8895 RepID=UPI0021F8801A|nr:FYN-binding protein 1 isoform X2 [Apus apus]
MAKFEKANRSTEDVSGSSQPAKVPEEPTLTGLQTRKAALEKFERQGNAALASGPSTFHKPVHLRPSLGAKPSADDEGEKDSGPQYLKPVAQKFGVQLKATNRENDGKPGCAKPPAKTSDLEKEPKQNYGKLRCTKPPTTTSDLTKEEPQQYDGKPGCTKTLTKTSATTKEEPRSLLYPKLAGNKFLNSAPHEKEKNYLGAKPSSNCAPQESESKPASSKVTGHTKTLMSAKQENEPKPLFSKPPLAQKPSISHEVSHKDNKKVFLQKGLSSARTTMHSFKAAEEMHENSNSVAEAAGSHFSKMALKPAGHWSQSSQGIPKNAEEKSEETGKRPANIFRNKIAREESDSSSKICKTNTALAAGVLSGGSQEKEDGDRSSGTLKRKNLPPLFKLGQPPKKPSRPPIVDLEKFQKVIQRDNPDSEGVKQTAPSSAGLSQPVHPPHPATQLPPPPPASHPSLQWPAAPSLPPRNIKPSSETVIPDNEESYDDVEFVSQGHGNTEGGQESEGEMYEDISDMRSSRRKEKKQYKGEKRKTDHEKKEQKEKEKKEQEIRKKFKLTGPIQVLHQARARVDCKGGKNELTVKQGDEIEIIRLTDNPEGKWLGRIKGCYGYIKTTIVEIDYDSLRRKQQPSTRAAVKHSESDQEVYDDVGEQDSITSQSGGQSGEGNKFPPPPSDQEIYDGIDDEDTVTGMSSSTKQSGKECGDNDVYDDVDSSDFPPPLPELNTSKSACLGKVKSDESDAQKCKNMEREEKEFRKKFKFEGEIKVLYSTTTVLNLTKRRWGPKDLQVKPGETLEVIESTDDTKVLCRNEEGKYGYVLRSNLVENDAEIYDDIGDDCIYDNA